MADNFRATVRAADFELGHSSRRGNPGRALVDFGEPPDQILYLNFDNDWKNTFIGGHVTLDPGNLNDGTHLNGLTFGRNSGEGIASKRIDSPPEGSRWGLDFYTARENRMHIDVNGNVGIGTISPQAKLDVNGSVRADNFIAGSFTLNGDLLAPRLNVGSGHWLSGDYATIAGGYQNKASGYTATIAGGALNEAIDSWASVGGGWQNRAAEQYATVPGGADNQATGRYSFAAGHHARANHAGSFVWADSDDTLFVSAVPDEFAVRANGGVRIEGPVGLSSDNGLSLPAADRPLITRGWDPFTSGPYAGFGRWGLFMEPYRLVMGFPKKSSSSFDVAAFDVDGSSSSVLRVSSDGVWVPLIEMFAQLHVHGHIFAEAYSDWDWGDAAAKQSLAAVDSKQILENVTVLPIHWKKDRHGKPHLGPSARDFNTAFGLGSDDKATSLGDKASVALAAIQGLNQKLENTVKERDARIATLEQSVAELRAMVNTLAEKVNNGAAQ